MEALLLRIFAAAAVVGWFVSPLWIVGTIALVLSSFRRKQRPALGDTAALILIVGLAGLYLFLSVQD